LALRLRQLGQIRANAYAFSNGWALSHSLWYGEQMSFAIFSAVKRVNHGVTGPIDDSHGRAAVNLVSEHDMFTRMGERSLDRFNENHRRLANEKGIIWFRPEPQEGLASGQELDVIEEHLERPALGW